jgi:hypothetical protein
MTDAQINAAIAEACNWPGNLICRDYNGNLWPADPPDFCRDLNKMRWAEQYIEDRNKYLNILANLTEALEASNVDNDWDFLRATARQRAEAFLRTLGKWEDAQ